MARNMSVCGVVRIVIVLSVWRIGRIRRVVVINMLMQMLWQLLMVTIF